MAWMWWLAAPGIIVVLGSAMIGRRDRRAYARVQRDPMAAHRAVLDALAQVEVASSPAREHGTSRARAHGTSNSAS